MLKAGAACVPLDPAYPKERLSYMLSDSETPLVLSQPGVLSEVTDFDAEVVNLEPDWKAFAEESRENVRSSVTGKSRLHHLYLGSTGKPRGVLLPHRGLVNRRRCCRGVVRDDDDRSHGAICLDLVRHRNEIFPTWISGGSLIVREEDASLAVSDFLRWWCERRHGSRSADSLFSWHELVRELAESTVKLLPKCLRLVIVGGEKAQSGALATWRKLAGSKVRWVNTYGPTETSVIVTSFEPKESEEVPAVLPIGRPIANTKIYILNKNIRRCLWALLGDLSFPVLGWPADT